jgi:hypothetical protein
MNLLASLTVLFTLLQVPPPPPPATFLGVYKGMESGRVVIEVEGGQSMRMFVTSSTKFIRDGKKAKASDFQEGEKVSVDADRDMRMNLIAVRVETVNAKSAVPPDKQENQK